MTIKTQTYSLTGILFSMCLSLVLVVATVSAVNLAIPNLAVHLGASNTQLTWIADAYTVALAALVLPLGALGDRIGRRNVLIAGNIVFGIAAVFASRVTTADTLIFWRTIMGVGAAMIMPGTLSTITSAFPEHRRNRAVATWSGFASAGAIIGMLVSGALLEKWNWDSIFIASALLAGIAAIAAYFLSPNTKEVKHHSIDYVGGLSLVALVGGLVYAIIEGNDQGWTEHKTLIATGVSLLGLVLYILSSLRTKHALLDVRLFKLRGFSTGSATVMVQFMAFFGFLFVGLQFLQLILGYSPLKSAAALIPVGIVVIATAQLTPRLVMKFGSRILMVVGLLLISSSMFYTSRLTADSSYIPFLTGLIVAGLGIGMTSSTATSSITKSLPRDKQGVASATNDASREVGAAIGVALMGSVYGNHYRDNLPDTLNQLPLKAAEAVRHSAAAGLEIAKQTGPYASKLTDAVKDAFIHGLSASLIVVAIILLIVAMLVALFGLRKQQESNLNE